jgi:hypothetical protein
MVAEEDHARDVVDLDRGARQSAIDFAAAEVQTTDSTLAARARVQDLRTELVLAEDGHLDATTASPEHPTDRSPGSEVELRVTAGAGARRSRSPRLGRRPAPIVETATHPWWIISG